MILYGSRPDVSSVLGKYRLYAIARPILGALCLVGALLLPVSVFVVLAVCWLLLTVLSVRSLCALIYILFSYLDRGEDV